MFIVIIIFKTKLVVTMNYLTWRHSLHLIYKQIKALNVNNQD